MRNLFVMATMLSFCFVANAQVATEKPPQCPLKIAQIPAGPLGEVDQSFLDSYCALQVSVFTRQTPYVVVSGSNLILHWGAGTGKVPDEKKGIPDTYHALKDVAHVPFSVYLLLISVEKGFVTVDQRTALTTLKDKIEAANSSLDSKYFAKDQIDRQRQILDASDRLVLPTLNTGHTSETTLSAFASEMGPLMLQNAWDAGCEQIKTTHAQMMAWKRQLTEEEWANLPDVTVRRDSTDYLMVFFTAVLAAAGAIGTYYAVKTLRVLRHEARIAVAALKHTAKFANAASRNAEAAKISADTSQKTLALASDTAEKQLRAYVCVESACVKFPHPQVPEAQVHFKNYGQTPAYYFRGWIHTWFTEHPLSEVLPLAPDDLRKGTELLAPGRRSIFVTPRKPPFHLNFLEQLGTEKLTMYVYGEVYYRDAFGKEQWTKYRLIYGGTGGIRKVPDKEEWILNPDTEGNEAS